MHRHFDKFVLPVLAIIAIALSNTPGFAESTDDIKSRGLLRCGVSGNLAGFSQRQLGNRWEGFDVDICRALSAALFGNPNLVRFRAVGVPPDTRPLTNNEIDILVSPFVGTPLHQNGIRAPAPYFYSGSAFLVRRALKLKSARGLRDGRICATNSARNSEAVSNFLNESQLRVVFRSADRIEDTVRAYTRAECDALLLNHALLAAVQSKFRNPSRHEILEPTVGVTGAGLLTAAGNEGWASIVRGTLNTLILAEMAGVTRELASQHPPEALSALSRDIAVQLNVVNPDRLSEEWLFAVLRHVGNYGEIYERNLRVALNPSLSRSVNALRQDGGMLGVTELEDQVRENVIKIMQTIK